MTQREIERRLHEEYLRRTIESMCGKRALRDVEWQRGIGGLSDGCVYQRHGDAEKR